MRSILCGFAAGVWYLQQRAALPSSSGLAICIVLICMASGAAILVHRNQQTLCYWIDKGAGKVKKKLPLPLTLVLAMLAIVPVSARRLLACIVLGCALTAALVSGYGFAAWRAKMRLANTLPIALEQRDIQVIGTVVGLPATDARRIRFLFDIKNPKLAHFSNETRRAARAQTAQKIVRQAGSDKVADPSGNALNDMRSFPRRVQLSWYAQPEMPLPALHVGERWQLTVRLTRVHGYANGYGTDFEASMLERNVRAIGYVRAQPAPVLIATHTREIGIAIDRWREAMRERIAEVLADTPHTGVIAALAIGLQSAISPDDWTLFTRTGTNHLVAISGLHISLAAGFAAAIFGGLWRYSGFIGHSYDWPLKIASPRVATFAGVCAGLAYAALAGLGIPAQRALIMLMVVAIAMFSAREVGSSVKLAWALFAVLLIDPWAVNSAGFWLSFCAVAVILITITGQCKSDSLIKGKWHRIHNRLIAAIRIQVAITFGLIPITALWFAQISLISLLANLIAIPWVSFLVTPFVLAGIVLPTPLDAWAFYAAHALFSILAVGLRVLAAPYWALWPLRTPDNVVLTLAVLGAACWVISFKSFKSKSNNNAKLSSRFSSSPSSPSSPSFSSKFPINDQAVILRRCLRALAVLLFAPLFFGRSSSPASGEFKITVLDVGQGAATLIETARHRLLFDAGPSYDGGANAGQRIVVPYLRAKRINQLDMLVVSHADSDHAGGAEAVLTALPIAQLRASLPLTHPLWHVMQLLQSQSSSPSKSKLKSASHNDQRSIARCHAGESWVWDGVKFTLLWPLGADSPEVRSAPNARSCVLRVENHQHAALLTGDIETPEERQLILRYQNQNQDQAKMLRAAVLIAPHHGSRTSSSNRFLEAVNAREAVFQVGYRNRFHHPNQRVITRYLARDIRVHRSDRDGEVHFETKGKALLVERFREVKKRYWMGK